jgi:hypothetical protein
MNDFKNDLVIKINSQGEQDDRLKRVQSYLSKERG